MPVLLITVSYRASDRQLSGDNVSCLADFRRANAVQYSREKDMIYCNAIVDTVEPPPAHGQGLGKFRVECWGKPPNDFVRVYTISAKDENGAAREGIDKFVSDISALLNSQDA